MGPYGHFPLRRGVGRRIQSGGKGLRRKRTDGISGKLGEKTELLGFFRKRDALFRRMEKLYVYANMRHDEDIRISKYTSYTAMMGTLVSKMMADMAFVEPELTALSEEKLKSYIADPDFSEYDYMLEKIEKSKVHVLSEGEEKILAWRGIFPDGFLPCSPCSTMPTSTMPR